MDNKDVHSIIEEINNTENTVIRILKDTVIDYRKICKKLTIASSISIIINFIFILYHIFSIV